MQVHDVIIIKGAGEEEYTSWLEYQGEVPRS